MSIDTPLPTKLRLALPIIEPPAEPAREARTMPHRLIPLFPYPKMFLVGLVSGGSSLLAAAMDERAITVAMAIVAFGAVLAQPAMRAYDKYRERKREADALDRQAVTDEYLVVVRSNDERGRKIEELEAQNGDQQKQIDALKAQLQKLAGKAKAAVKHVSKKIDENAERIAAVEAHQGISSNLELPATPVDAKP
jgi:hypothetical protein